ncbi:MAG: glycosyltransferase family 4 protein [Phycisphaerae bacterium]
MSLRFCIVSTFYPPFNFGGDGIYAHRLANGLARLGHAVTVLHSPSAYEMLSGTRPTVAYDDHAYVTVRPIRTPLGALGLLATQQLGRPCFQGRQLRQWLDRGEYDVIHYNNVSLLGGPHVFGYGRGLKLCTLIEHWLICPTHVLWKFNREVCTKPECLRCQLIHRRPPQLWRYTGLMRRATRHIDAFVGPSLFTMRMHRERGIRGRMVQLPLFDSRAGVPDAVADRSNAGRPFFLFVGRLEQIKGVQTLIPVFREMSQVDLLIAGNGNYEAELRRQAGGAANIKFLGRASRAQLEALYRDAIATLVPSLCYETFGIIVAESFCASTPVIVYAQSSLEEIVGTHGGGLMYRTPDELRAALERLAADRPQRDELGRKGRAAYDAEFGEAPFLAHYLAVVQTLLAEKRAGGTVAADRGDGLLAGRPVLA